MTLSPQQLAQKGLMLFKWIAPGEPSASLFIDFRLCYTFGVRNPNTVLSGFSTLTSLPPPL